MKLLPSRGRVTIPAALVVVIYSLSVVADEPAGPSPPTPDAPPGEVCRQAAVPQEQSPEVATDNPASRRIHGVFCHTSYPAAWTAAQKTNRPILVYVTSTGCPHCVQMIQQTYQRPAIKQVMDQQFETVYVDRHQQPKLVQKMRVRWYPTTIVVAPDNKVLDRIEGYVDASVLAQRLETQLAIHDAVAADTEKSLVQK